MGRTDNAEAITRAINDFRDTEIMGPFLKKYGNEVLNMLTTEWNISDFGRVQREEGAAEILIELVERKMHIDSKTFDEAVAELHLTDKEIKQCYSMRKSTQDGHCGRQGV